jgi:hypothetical protein
MHQIFTDHNKVPTTMAGLGEQAGAKNKCETGEGHQRRMQGLWSHLRAGQGALPGGGKAKIDSGKLLRLLAGSFYDLYKEF